ncbi:MAG TPA: HAD-IA family hydrolase [Thermomicrobiales bacterium]|nr:HAD-IA family hydrolase [Thermomicrobiales bacterium]
MSRTPPEPLITHHSSLVTRRSALLFDLDGTLVDSVELIVRAFQHTAARRLGRPFDRAAIVATIGRPLPAVLEELAPGAGESLLAAYRAFVVEHHDALVRAYPGAVEALVALRARGYRLGIVTAKGRAQAELAFRLCRLTPLVDVAICHEDAPRHKPAPDPLLAAAARLGLPPGACCYVGDSVFDLVAARAAGMASVAVTWGAGLPADLAAERPGALVHDFAALLDRFPAVAGRPVGAGAERRA